LVTFLQALSELLPVSASDPTKSLHDPAGSSGPGNKSVFASLVRRSYGFHATISILVAALVGVTDYLTGLEPSMLVLYLLPIAWGVWFISRRFGIFLSVLCSVFALTADLLAEGPVRNAKVEGWNTLINISAFLIVVWLLAILRDLMLRLEWRVQKRTEALRHEIAERTRLEREVLEVSEREQRRIGLDLHDGLGQHLTGAALTCQVLRDRLASRDASEVAEAERVVTLIEDAIEITRSLAHGLSPVFLESDGLYCALHELAAYVSAHFRIRCEFHGEMTMEITPEKSMHLYRIAQEAVTNVARHSGATRLTVTLGRTESGRVRLEVADNGSGMSHSNNGNGTGLGLRTMAHRANLMGAVFEVVPREGGGTTVVCELPSDESTVAV
jgi:signal transduction histidine kinase